VTTKNISARRWSVWVTRVVTRLALRIEHWPAPSGRVSNGALPNLSSVSDSAVLVCDLPGKAGGHPQSARESSIVAGDSVLHSTYFRADPLTSYTTRHSRQLGLNTLIPIGRLLSGGSNFPPWDPTKLNPQPDKSCVTASTPLRILTIFIMAGETLIGLHRSEADTPDTPSEKSSQWGHMRRVPTEYPVGPLPSHRAAPFSGAITKSLATRQELIPRTPYLGS
jgi:hypothetical protein